MPHRRSLLLAARRIVLGALPLSVAACAGEGRVTVVVDTTGSGGALEVLAIPVDPATIAPSGNAREPARGASPRADSIARLLALRDSVTTLDAQFQLAREALNTEAERFDSLDRTSAAYARAWATHRARFVEAERLRTARDRIRERAAAYAARLGDAAPPDDSTRRARALTSRRTALDAATDGDRPRILANARLGIVTLDLDPGPWWIGVTGHEGAPGSFTRVDVARGSRDTIRIRP